MWDVSFATRASSQVEVRDGDKGIACFGASAVEASLAFVDRESAPDAAGVLAQLRLAEPLALLPGERWIFRGFHKSIDGATLGGGVVLAPSPRRRRRGRDLEELNALAAADVDRALAAFVTAHGELGVPRAQLHAALPFSRADIDRALAASPLIETAPTREARVISPMALESLTSALEELLSAHHRSDPSSPGLALEELRTRVRPGADAAVFSAITDALVERRRLSRQDGHVALAGFTPSVSDSERALDAAVIALLDAAQLSPPRVEDLPSTLADRGTSCDRPAVDKAIVRLVARGDAVRVAKDLALSAAALERFVAEVRRYFDDNEWLDAQALKQMTGLSRKWLIPLAEWLDRAHVTVRMGDRRRLRR
jgi:selenocysteine-specific elongation factor